MKFPSQDQAVEENGCNMDSEHNLAPKIEIESDNESVTETRAPNRTVVVHNLSEIAMQDEHPVSVDPTLEQYFMFLIEIFITKHLTAQEVRECILSEEDWFRWMIFHEQLHRAIRTLRLALTVSGRVLFGDGLPTAQNYDELPHPLRPGMAGPDELLDILSQVSEEIFTVRSEIFLTNNLSAQQVRELIVTQQDWFRWSIFLEQLCNSKKTLGLALEVAGRVIFK
jgi:hypothetical protein